MIDEWRCLCSFHCLSRLLPSDPLSLSLCFILIRHLIFTKDGSANFAVGLHDALPPCVGLSVNLTTNGKPPPISIMSSHPFQSISRSRIKARTIWPSQKVQTRLISFSNQTRSTRKPLKPTFAPTFTDAHSTSLTNALAQQKPFHCQGSWKFPAEQMQLFYKTSSDVRYVLQYFLSPNAC